MRIEPPADTKQGVQRMKVDRQTAALVRRLGTLEPGMRVIVVVDVGEDGRRSWSLAHCTEATQ